MQKEYKYEGTHIRVYSQEKTVLTTNTTVKSSIVSKAILDMIEKLESGGDA